MRAGEPQHLKGINGAHAHGQACVGNENPGACIRLRSFVRNYGVLMIAGISDEEIIGVVSCEIG